MKLKSKILTVLLACTLGVTPVMAIDIQDTFSYSNIANTISTIDDNIYVITGANTVKAKGPSILGYQSTAFNTNDKWVDVLTGDDGSLLTNIVKMSSNTVKVYFLDNSGDIYFLDKYASKVIAPTGVKFKDICAVGTPDYGHSLAFAISTNGDVYYVNGTSMTKINDLSNGDRFKQGRYEQTINVSCLLIHTDGTVTDMNLNNKHVKLALKNVVNMYTNDAYCNSYILFSSGRLSLFDLYGFGLTPMVLPDGEIFINMVTSSRTKKPYLVTNKNIYEISNTTLKKVALDVTPVAISYNILLDNKGDYYKVNEITDTTCNLTKLSDEDMKKWANVNPIVSDYELAHFSLERDSIFDRGNACSVEFSLVTNEKPSAFNIYYAKTSSSGNKESWKLIESAVKFETLNPVEYVTGITDNTGVAIKGYTYRYNWNLDNISDLTDIQIIVDPIY